MKNFLLKLRHRFWFTPSEVRELQIEATLKEEARLGYEWRRLHEREATVRAQLADLNRVWANPDRQKDSILVGMSVSRFILGGSSIPRETVVRDVSTRLLEQLNRASLS